MSGKTHASDKPAQAQPAIPERLPPRWPIQGPSQKASQLRHAVDKLLDGQPLDGHALLPSDDLCLLWLDPGYGWLLGLFTAQVAQLQQTHGYGRDDGQQILQTALLLEMALLQTAPRFHPAMKLLNWPPRTVMVNRLPGLPAALHRPHTQQNPFQGFHFPPLRILVLVGP